MQIIAHRGASYDAPENTLTAIQLAWEQDADAVEIDIHLSQDGHIVVLHDDNTLRVAGRDKKVAEQTLAELQQLRIGKEPAHSTEHIPLLDEVIATMPPGKRLVIEVKCGPEIIPALQQALTRFSQQHQAPNPWQPFVIIAFSYSTLSAIKQSLPQVETLWLTAFTTDSATGTLSPAADHLIAQAKAASFEGLDVHYNGALASTLIQQAHDAGLSCYVWTVNAVEVARQLKATGIDGITTDRPGWLRQHLAS